MWCISVVLCVVVVLSAKNQINIDGASSNWCRTSTSILARTKPHLYDVGVIYYLCENAFKKMAAKKVEQPPRAWLRIVAKCMKSLQITTKVLPSWHADAEWTCSCCVFRLDDDDDATEASPPRLSVREHLLPLCEEIAASERVHHVHSLSIWGDRPPEHWCVLSMTLCLTKRAHTTHSGEKE